jgi:MATE family multidrug resistance protein
VKFTFPTRAQVAPLLAVGGALALGQLTSSSLYSLTTQRAALAGTAAAAAHQIQLQLWWLLSYFPVPLYLASQSLLGRSLAKGDVPRAQATLNVLLKLGLALAAALTLANAIVPIAAGGLFSSDPQVLGLLRQTLPAAAAAQALASVNTVAEGIFAGCGRLRHVAAVSVSSAVVGAAAMLAMPPGEWGLMGPWLGLFIFEGYRTVVHGLRWRSLLDDVACGKARGAVPRAL